VRVGQCSWQKKTKRNRNRLAEKVSEDRDNPHPPSKRPVQMIKRMGEAVVVEGQTQRGRAPARPRVVYGWKVWARRVPFIPPVPDRDGEGNSVLREWGRLDYFANQPQKSII